jgi:hypothetical protein
MPRKDCGYCSRKPGRWPLNGLEAANVSHGTSRIPGDVREAAKADPDQVQSYQYTF